MSRSSSKPVVGRRALVFECQPKIAEALIRLEPERPAHRMLLGDRVRLDRQAGEQQAPNLCEMRERIGVVRVARSAHPERVLVELDALAVHVAEHHGAHPPVAERQRLVPFARRVVVEENVRPGRWASVGEGASQSVAAATRSLFS